MSLILFESKALDFIAIFLECVLNDDAAKLCSPWKIAATPYGTLQVCEPKY